MSRALRLKRRLPMLILPISSLFSLQPSASIENMSIIAGWHLPFRQFSTILRMWAFLLSLRLARLSSFSSGAEWDPLGAWAIVLDAIFWMMSSFLRWVGAAEAHTALQYSRLDLTNAVYASRRSSVAIEWAALFRVPSSPWQPLSQCEWKRWDFNLTRPPAVSLHLQI